MMLLNRIVELPLIDINGVEKIIQTSVSLMQYNTHVFTCTILLR